MPKKRTVGALCQVIIFKTFIFAANILNLKAEMPLIFSSAKNHILTSFLVNSIQFFKNSCSGRKLLHDTVTIAGFKSIKKIRYYAGLDARIALLLSSSGLAKNV